jgi:hypothetical protein
MARMPSRRPCPEHQKEWHGLYVDKNLHDIWLEKLNLLNVFNLISICEGHYRNQNARSGEPHINLRMKGDMLQSLLSKTPETDTYNFIQEQLNRLFVSESTIADVVIEHKVRIQHLQYSVCQDTTSHIRCRLRKTSEEMTSEIINWFEEIVILIQSLDESINNYLLS